jgi:hypothetical protein
LLNNLHKIDRAGSGGWFFPSFSVIFEKKKCISPVNFDKTSRETLRERERERERERDYQFPPCFSFSILEKIEENNNSCGQGVADREESTPNSGGRTRTLSGNRQAGRRK